MHVIVELSSVTYLADTESIHNMFILLSYASCKHCVSQVVGFQLEGCTFDGTRLIENTRDTSSVSTIPPCTVAWIPKEAPPPYPETESISLPLYYSAERERLVICIDMPCQGDKVQWIQCGAATFLKDH